MTANRPLSNLFGDKAPRGRGQIKISTLSTINHRDLSLRPIIPGVLLGLFSSGFSAIGSWFIPHCFNIASIILCTMKSLLFLCTSG